MFRRVRFTSSVLLKNNRMFPVRSKIRGKPFGLPVNSEIADASKNACLLDGGAERDRTDDLLLAKQALSQLSYTPDTTGGSGWIRTIDPRLIKTVL